LAQGEVLSNSHLKQLGELVFAPCSREGNGALTQAMVLRSHSWLVSEMGIWDATETVREQEAEVSSGIQFSS